MVREREFAKKIASLEEVFGFLEGFYAEEGISARSGLTLSLVVEELFTNLVKYNTASHNPIVLRVSRQEKQAHLELVDRDVDRFDPSTLPPVDVDLPMAERRPGGLGLHLVRAIVDRITFDYQDRVMRIAVVKDLEPADV